MKRAIMIHRIDFAAILVLVLGAIFVSGYILEHQPSFVFGQSYYTVKAPFATAAAVTAGQGQAITIAGVQVGQVGGVSLQDGQAVVTMHIYKKYAPIYRNATVLLRPRTPLKDMYLALDPGTKSAGKVPNGGSLTAAQTNPDVDVSQILSSLDADTRNYLVLLLASAAQAFHDNGSTQAAPSPKAVADLRGTLKRFEPLDRDTLSLTHLIAARDNHLRRSIHNLNLVANSLGDVDTELSSLVSTSDTNFSAIARNDAQLEQTLSLFPGTLRQTQQTVGKVKTFSQASATTLPQLLPFARNLGPALAAARPLFRDTTPVIKNQLRPFSVAVQPLARTLAPASASLSQAIPKLSKTDRRPQRPVQHARLPEEGRRAGLPVLGLVAIAHRRQPDLRPGRQRPRAPGDLHGDVPGAELLRADAPALQPAARGDPRSAQPAADRRLAGRDADHPAPTSSTARR